MQTSLGNVAKIYTSDRADAIFAEAHDFETTKQMLAQAIYDNYKAGVNAKRTAGLSKSSASSSVGSVFAASSVVLTPLETAIWRADKAKEVFANTPNSTIVISGPEAVKNGAETEAVLTHKDFIDKLAEIAKGGILVVCYRQRQYFCNY